MADEFQVENHGGSFITVRHVAEGHLYTLPTTQAFGGARTLSAEMILGKNDRAAHGPEDFARRARAFAEVEARKAGIID